MKIDEVLTKLDLSKPDELYEGLYLIFEQLNNEIKSNKEEIKYLRDKYDNLYSEVKVKYPDCTIIDTANNISDVVFNGWTTPRSSSSTTSFSTGVYL